MMPPTALSEIVTSAPAAVELQDVDTPQLRRLLEESIGLTEAAIRRVALIWVELLRRGEDLSNVRFALGPLMPAVAEGRLLPRLVVDMAGQARALRRLAELPVRVQEELAQGRELEVLRGDGSVQRKRLTALRFPEICAAVRDGRVLSVAEQRAALRTVMARPRAKSSVLSVRLAAPDMEAAGAAAAAAGVALDHWVRGLIRAALAEGGHTPAAPPVAVREAPL